jgi:hypothetical protein
MGLWTLPIIQNSKQPEKTMFLKLDLHPSTADVESFRKRGGGSVTVTNKNLVQEKVKRRLNSGNACSEPSVFSSAVEKRKN